MEAIATKCLYSSIDDTGIIAILRILQRDQNVSKVGNPRERNRDISRVWNSKEIGVSRESGIPERSECLDSRESQKDRNVSRTRNFRNVGLSRKPKPTDHLEIPIIQDSEHPSRKFPEFREFFFSSRQKKIFIHAPSYISNHVSYLKLLYDPF